MVYSKVLIEMIRSALKKGNQRIVEVGKEFGKTSETVKNETAFLEKGLFNRYKSYSSSGNIKINIPKVIKDIKSGYLKADEVNELLTKTTGESINFADQRLKKSPFGGISTKTKLKKKAEDIAPGEDWKDVIESLSTISNDFQTEYELFRDEFILTERMDLVPLLFEEKVKSYSELDAMAKTMHDLRLERTKGESINEKIKNE